MVSAFFKNIAQKMTLIELLQNRAAIQEESGNEMKARFEAYSLELQEVLIGTARAATGDQTIENILIQLRSRQVAREQNRKASLTFTEQNRNIVIDGTEGQVYAPKTRPSRPPGSSRRHVSWRFAVPRNGWIVANELLELADTINGGFHRQRPGPTRRNRSEVSV